MEQEVLEHNLRRSATTRLRQPAASQTQALYLRDSHQLLASFVRFHELNCCFRLATNLLLTRRSFRFLRTPSFPTKARSTYEDCNIIHIAIYQYMLYIIYDAQNDAQKTTFSQTHLPSFSERPMFGLPAPRQHRLGLNSDFDSPLWHGHRWHRWAKLSLVNHHTFMLVRAARAGGSAASAQAGPPGPVTS